MTDARSHIDDAPSSLKGEVSRVPAHPFIRGLLTVSGLLLIRAFAAVFIRYCLGFKGIAVVTVRDRIFHMETEWYFFGKKVRQTATNAPISRLAAVRFENRQQFMYSVVGFGALMVGALFGMQWFLDGLHAGYPYLVVAGALLIAAGAAADVFLYLYVPEGSGRSHLVFALGPWLVRLKGVNAEAAEKAVRAVCASWNPGRPEN